MSQFHDELKTIMDGYVHQVYRLTKQFPKEELYGVTSQLRRSSLSVILNYLEGYARGQSKVHKNFLGISYGSLKESKYLLNFSCVEGYLSRQEYTKIIPIAEHIGSMLWGMLKKL